MEKKYYTGDDDDDDDYRMIKITIVIALEQIISIYNQSIKTTPTASKATAEQHTCFLFIV